MRPTCFTAVPVILITDGDGLPAPSIGFDESDNDHTRTAECTTSTKSDNDAECTTSTKSGPLVAESNGLAALPMSEALAFPANSIPDNPASVTSDKLANSDGAESYDEECEFVVSLCNARDALFLKEEPSKRMLRKCIDAWASTAEVGDVLGLNTISHIMEVTNDRGEIICANARIVTSVDDNGDVTGSMTVYPNLARSYVSFIYSLHGFLHAAQFQCIELDVMKVLPSTSNDFVTASIRDGSPASIVFELLVRRRDPADISVPPGVTFTQEDLRRLADNCKVYEASGAMLPGLRNRTIMLHGVQKIDDVSVAPAYW